MAPIRNSSRNCFVIGGILNVIYCSFFFFLYCLFVSEISNCFLFESAPQREENYTIISHKDEIVVESLTDCQCVIFEWFVLRSTRSSVLLREFCLGILFCRLIRLELPHRLLPPRWSSAELNGYKLCFANGLLFILN